MIEQIREILRVHGRLKVGVESISVDTNLYDVGLTSHGVVSVWVALENCFEIELPLMKREAFQSMDAIQRAMSAVMSTAPGAAAAVLVDEQPLQ
jgi:acyl carrier protein